ncbi:hypothetical protein [Noviherbaspirillum pedocola]|uniref:Uncharacterized protein n=1 Tax=Noviherbaspirillum pedocola TaxID=2801341 RepID=A0A934W8L3_9BURK|nr:hypothetical protein [Noviherbaspirillum pedocola]MBK4737710.1 hypothetical protein [Noviherbaspirillum pedocola]
MTSLSHANLRRLLFAAVFAASCLMAAMPSWARSGGSAEALRAAYTDMQTQFANNQFGQPLVLESSEEPGRLQGDAYALMDYPIAKVEGALNTQQQWCEMLILHLNTKYCRAAQVGGAPGLTVYIGSKNPEPLERSYRVDFAWQVAAMKPEYFNIRLAADKGPLGTSDYRIAVEATSVPGNRTLLHLTYSYQYGTMGSLAMKTYLGTKGADKVGFTVLSNDNGKPVYIDGVRGVVERNTMRYYLAIDSYLKTVDTPEGQRQEKRLLSWFSATERHPRQLHEVDRDDYLQMKREEIRRQNSQ